MTMNAMKYSQEVTVVVTGWQHSAIGMTGWQ